MKSLNNNFKLNIFILAITIFIFSCSENTAISPPPVFVGMMSSTMTNFAEDVPIPISVTFTDEVQTSGQDSTTSAQTILTFEKADVIVNHANLYNFVKNTNTNYTFDLSPHLIGEVGVYDTISVDIPANVCANSSNIFNLESEQFIITRGDSSENGMSQSGKVSIHGIITDAVSNERAEGVTVYWVHDDEVLSVQSDELGYYIIENLLAESKYELTFEKTGFATMNYLIDLDSLIIQEINLTYNISIYPLTSSVHGIVYKQIETDSDTTSANIELAANVSVIADFTDPSSIESFSPNQYTTTTNGSGEYTFSYLPSTASVNLKTLPYYSNEYDFSVQTKTVSLSPNMTVEVDNIILPLDVLVPFVVQNTFDYGNIIDVDDNIAITFSTIMDDATFSVELKNSSTSDIVPIDISWDNNKITLTIDPLVSLQKSAAYSLSISGLSQNNGNFNEAYSFNTQDGIQYVSTNLYNVEGNFDNFDINSHIEIDFTMQPDLSNISNSIVLYDPSNSEISIEYSLLGNTLIITPVAELEYSQNYILFYTIYSGLPGDFISGTFTFTTLQNVSSVPLSVTDFTSISYGWDFNTTQFTFQWTNVENAIGYKIYAHDSNLNTDYVNVGSYSANDHLLYQEGLVDLSLFPQFDYYLDDAIQTPLAGDVNIYFNVVAYNELGESALSNTRTIHDYIDPVITLVYDSTNNYGPNNSSYSYARNFNLILAASEYMDLNLSYYFGESGGDPYLLDTNDVNFEWNADQMGGIMNISVDGGQNGAGGDTLIITGLRDNSLNMMWQNTEGITSYKYYFILGGFEYYNFNDNQIPNEFVQGNTNNLWMITSNTYDIYEGGYSLISNSDTSYTADSIQFSINIPTSTKSTTKFVSKCVTFGTGEFFVNGTSITTLNNSSFIQNEYVFTTSSSTQANTFKWVYNSGNSAGYFVIDMIEVIW